MILFKNKKIISFLVASILVLSFSVCAYADDDSGDTSTSPEDRLATEEEILQLDTAISETSHNLALLMASGDSVKATDYEQATYNLLSSIFGSSTSSWASIVATRLGYLSTINTSANGLVVKLTGFYNSINPDYDTTGISMYDLGHGILTALTSIDPNDGDLTIIETLVYITSALDDLDTDLTAILNSTYSIDNKLININTSIIQFKSDLLTSISTLTSDLNAGFTNVNANMALIISRLQSIQNDFNNITWDTVTTYVKLYSDINLTNEITSGNLSNNTYYYVNFKFNTSDWNYILRLTLPLSITNTSNLFNNKIVLDSFYVKSGNNIYLTDKQPNVYLYNNRTKYSVLFYNSGLIPNADYILKIYINANNYPIHKYDSGSVQLLNNTSQDFYTIYNWFSNYSFYETWKSLYASDDLIQAKENQQTYENQAIEDFTGSGSASASLSDLGGLKSVSSAFKSGLDSGGSVSNALSIFSNNSGFWGWFSQSNYNDINNLSNSSSNTRSGNNIQEDIIDFYSDNKLNLLYLLQNVGN